MKSRFRALVAAAALVVSWAVTPVSPASAAYADALVMTGSGTISPGLGLLPEHQWMSFTGVATLVGTEGIAVTVNCDFSGQDLAGSIAAGGGTMSGGCGPLTCGLFVFTRDGASMVWDCVGIGTLGHLDCAFRPIDTLPTTEYTLLCQGYLTNV